MKILTSTMFLFLFFNVQGQTKVGFYTGLSQTVDHLFRNTESYMDMGPSFKFEKGSFNVFFTYAYGGVFNYNAANKPDSFHGNFKPYGLDYHLLGGGLKYRFRKEEAFYHPTLKITVLSEVGSSYRGSGLELGYEQNSMGEDYPLFSPTDHIYPYYQLSNGKNEKDKLLYYHTYNYISTPLVGSVFLGNEFQLFKGFFLNIELGYMFRAFRYSHNKWLPNESESPVEIVETHKLKETSNGKTIFIHYFEISLGINYTFSFKKEKPQP